MKIIAIQKVVDQRALRASVFSRVFPPRIILSAGTLLATALLLAFLFQPSLAEASDLYVVKSSRGVVTFTSRKPDGERSYSLFSPKRNSYSRVYSNSYRRSAGNWAGKARQSEFDDLIYAMSELYDLDPAFVKAVVHVESAFNPEATSPKGAMGLMQLMPGTARRFGVSEPYTPEENVRGGVTYLKMLYDRYSGDERLALAAYNAGEGLVDKTRTVPRITETQNYVQRVLVMREQYRCAFDGRKACST